VELDARIGDLRSRSMITLNKVHHVTTITQVAKDLGEDEDLLRDIAIEMEIEDGLIWVYGVGEDGVQAFTDFGIENLIDLLRMHKENRPGSNAGIPNNPIHLRPTPNAYLAAIVGLNEAEALLPVEPLHSTSCHVTLLR
jgi:hypothetical protein